VVRDSRGVKEAVDELLGAELLPQRGFKKSFIGRRCFRISRLAAEGLRVEDDPREMTHVITRGDKLATEISEKFRVTRLIALPVIDRFDKSFAEVAFPDPIDDDLRKTLVLGPHDLPGGIDFFTCLITFDKIGE